MNSPPRMAPRTDRAWKSGIRRATPAWPTRISVCAAPGLSTRRSRRPPEVALGDDRARRDRAVGSAPAGHQAIGQAHRSTRLEVAGHDQVVRAGSRPRSPRPLDARPVQRRHGRPGPRRRTVVGRVVRGRSSRRTPRRRGGAASARAWRRSFRRSSRIRSTSDSGNVGWATTSASSSRAGSSRLAGTSTPDRRRVPAGVGVERGAEPLGRLDRARSRRSARCPRSGPGPPGPSRPPRAAGSSAAPLRSTSWPTDERPAGQVGWSARSARCRGRDRSNGREVVGPRMAGRRAGRRSTGPTRGHRSCSGLLVGRLAVVGLGRGRGVGGPAPRRPAAAPGRRS